jgi:hypothetical protein
MSVRTARTKIQREDAIALRALFKREEAADSFGPVGYIAPVSAKRLKGFIGAQTIPQQQIIPIKTNADEIVLSEIIREGIFELHQTNRTRLSLRVITTEGTNTDRLKKIISALGAEVEATLPLNTNPFLQILYIGYNTEERRNPDQKAINSGYERLLHQARMRELLRADFPDLNTNHLMRQTETTNFEIRDNSRHTQTELALSMTTILGREMLVNSFGYSFQAAQHVLDDERNLIGTAYQNGNIVGLCVAERREIQLSYGRTIKMAELTDGVVKKDLQHNGIYSRLSTEVINYLYLTDTNVIFAESNPNKQGLINTIAKQGRRIAGILPQHAEIEGSMCDLVVTYLPQT